MSFQYEKLISSLMGTEMQLLLYDTISTLLKNRNKQDDRDDSSNFNTRCDQCVEVVLILVIVMTAQK